MPDRLLTHAFHTKPLRAGVTAARTMLKLAGVGSLLLRHLAATALVDLLDKDRDGKLDSEELAGPSMMLCRVASVGVLEIPTRELLQSLHHGDCAC